MGRAYKAATSCAAIAVVAMAAFAIPAIAEQVSGGLDETLRTGTTGNNSEIVQTIPISKHAGDTREVVMSLQPGNLGDLQDGDQIEATAEVEVSVCLKPNELHGSDRPCIGRTYGYNPTVEAELVLGAGGGATGGGSSISLGKQRLTCYQSQPNRNHHCVLVIADGPVSIDDASALPCNGETCHVNLVLSAWDRQAKSADRLVVGADSGGTAVNGDKGRVNVVRYRPGNQRRADPLYTDNPVRSEVPIASEGGKPKDTVVYSVEVPDLRAGDQLVIDGKMVAKIGQHAYNVFQTTSLILSESRESASRDGWPMKVGDLNGQIAEANGFNCTQGSSAHDDPCVARKVGVLEITRDSPKTLYINLTAGMAAQLFGDKWRSGDTAHVLNKGYLRVYRYDAAANDSPPPVKD